MSIFQENQNRQISYTGNGQPIWIGLYQSDAFVKFLKTGVATTAGVTETLLINTEAAGNVDHIDTGDNYTLVIASEITHPNASISVGDPITNITNGGSFPPLNFSQVAPLVTFPTIFWNGLGTYCSYNEVYVDSAGTQPAEFNSIDVTNGVVGKLEMKKNAAILDEFFNFEQGTTALKPAYKYDNINETGYIEFRPDTVVALNVVPTTPGVTSYTNDDFVDSFYVIDHGVQISIANREFFDFGDGVTLGNTSSAQFSIRLAGSAVQSANIAEGAHVIQVRRSAGAAFGNSIIWVDGVVVYDQPIYFPLITMGNSIRTFRSGTTSLWISRFYGGIYNHKGALNEPERTAIQTYLGNIIGLSI